MFDAALQWAMKADKTHFWRGYKKSVKLESPHDSVATIKKTITTRNKTDEYMRPAFDHRYHSSLFFRDEGHLVKLRQLGMTSTEEAKLVSMRDYIVKLANAVSRFDPILSCV